MAMHKYPGSFTLTRLSKKEKERLRDHILEVLGHDPQQTWTATDFREFHLTHTVFVFCC